MAIRYAVANGNWSNVATWNGGATLPTHGDMVYANGKTVVIDQNIDIGNEVTVTAGSFVPGQMYVITSVGTTNFTLIGAISNTVGIAFIATGVGAGTGQAETRSGIINSSLASPAILTNGTFTLDANYNLRMSIIGGGSVTLLTVGSNSSTDITGDVGFGRGSGASLLLTTPGNVTITGNVRGGSGGSGNAITLSATNLNLTVNGDIIGSTFSGARILVNTGGGPGCTITVNGSVFGSTTTNGTAIWLLATGSTILINGNITGGNASGSEGLSLGSASDVTIIGNLIGGNTTSAATCTNGTMTITGNVSGGNGTNGSGVTVGSTGVVTINGDVIGGTANGYGILMSGAVTVTVNGNILTPTTTHCVSSTGGTLIVNGSVTATLGNGVINTSSALTMTVTGTVTGGTASDAYGINFSVGGAVLTVNGTVTGGSGNNASGINGPASTTANTITINGDIVATSASNGIRSTSTNALAEIGVNGNLVDDIGGMKAVAANRWYWTAVPTNRAYTFSINKLSTYTWYSEDVWNSAYPIEADVRENVLFGAGDIFTGTLIVPDPQFVALGIPTDNTVGTATGDPSAIAGAVRTELTPELAFIDAAISSRLATIGYTAPDAAATVATAVRSELTTELARIDIPISEATTDVSGVPSAVRLELATELARIDIPISEATTDVSGVPAAVRSELATELARIDTAISTRLAAAGYTAPETKEAIAVAVEAALLNEGDGQQLIDAILQVINTNLDLPALELTAIANAVRSELATELARIDANVSTAGDPVTIAGAVRSELATELARIDIPVSDATTDISGIPTDVRAELAPELARVANCSTVDTTGAQLAALL